MNQVKLLLRNLKWFTLSHVKIKMNWLTQYTYIKPPSFILLSILLFVQHILTLILGAEDTNNRQNMEITPIAVYINVNK